MRLHFALWGRLCDPRALRECSRSSFCVEYTRAWRGDKENLNSILYENEKLRTVMKLKMAVNFRTSSSFTSRLFHVCQSTNCSLSSLHKIINESLNIVHCCDLCAKMKFKTQLNRKNKAYSPHTNERTRKTLTGTAKKKKIVSIRWLQCSSSLAVVWIVNLNRTFSTHCWYIEKSKTLKSFCENRENNSVREWNKIEEHVEFVNLRKLKTRRYST